MQALKVNERLEPGYALLSKAQDWSECQLPQTLVSAASLEITTALSRGDDPAGVLGRVYESTLSRGAQRKRGIFYTPKALVDYVVSKTIDASPKAGRVLDPSCGGGAFLMGIVDYYSERHRFGHRPSYKRRIVEERLAGIDIDKRAIDVCKVMLAMVAKGPVNTPWIRQADSLEIDLSDQGISTVVGNPPWGQKGFFIDSKQKDRYRQRFETAKGHLDPYGLFIEQIHRWLGEGCRWGLVLPEVFLLKGSQTLRQFVLGRTQLLEVLELGNIFKGVNLGAVVAIGEITNEKTTTEKSTEVGFSIEPKASRRKVSQSLWQNMPDQRINLHITKEEWSMWERLEAFPTLSDLFEIREGVHSGNMRDKLFVDGPPKKCFEKLIVGGKEMAPYSLAWMGRFLNTEVPLGEKDYCHLGKKGWRHARKILVRRTGDRVAAACDLDGWAASNNFFLLMPKQKVSDEFLDAATGLLNSELYTWCYRALNPRKGRLFAEIKIKHLRTMPFPMIAADCSNWKQLSMLARHARLDSSMSVAGELNQCVEKLFRVSPKERELIKIRQ